jgi:hypothetical protein
MPDELSLVRFCLTNYFAVNIASKPFSPIHTLLVNLVQALISSEPATEDEKEIKEHKKRQEKLKWITNYTHEKLKTKLATIEFVVFRNWSKGVNFEVDIGDKHYTLIELYDYLIDVKNELTAIVIEIGKKYAMDMPMSALGNTSVQNIQLD